MVFNVDVVAERRLELRTEKGTIEVVARLGSPKEVGKDEWTCACITRFANEERAMDIHGGDSMQALQLAMATLDVELQHGAKLRSGTLYYFDEPFISILEDSGMQRRSDNSRPSPDAT
jgi:hypothetical protein